MVVLVAVALLGFCVLNELAIRLVLIWKNTRSLQGWLRDMPSLRTRQKVGFDLMVRPSDHRALIYQLRPKMEVVNEGVVVKTNAEGFRDRDYPLSGKAGTMRIVGLGDSNMFGWGVPQDRTYLSVMERWLNEHGPPRRWEVINTGTPGYNTYMKVEALRLRLLKYRPDIVLLQHSINELPRFLHEYSDPWSLGRSYAYDQWIKKRPPNTATPGDEAREAPPGFEHMAGLEGLARALVTLRDLRDRHGFEVVILISHDRPVGMAHAIKQLGRRYGFHVLVRLLRTEDPTFVVSKVNRHPSVKGHLLVAEALLRFMHREGVLKKLTKR